MSENNESLMIRCERKALFKRDGKRVRDWAEINVADLPRENPPEVRCMYCHGAVHILRQQIENGPVDHAKHASRQDSERCKGGVYFKGEHNMSLNPVN